MERAKNTPDVIDSFRGRYAWLSNFYECEIPYENLTYPSTENAYMACKCPDFETRREFVDITAKEAKKRGYTYSLPQDWNERKLIIMEDLVRIKFTIHPHLNNLLLRTGNAEIVEGNVWKDYFWGTCNGKGENHLGKILMKIRKELC